MASSKKRNLMLYAYLTLAGNETSAALSSPASKGNHAKKTTIPVNSKKRSKILSNPSETRTTSFSAMWAGKIDSLPNVPPHTLILGTHPSVTSLEREHAFWWIAGDCLGFRRDTGISPSSGKPYALAKTLRYNNILPYEEQMKTLLAHGFCLWDVVQSCERKGSLDQDINNEVVNPIQEFCEEHPSIRRIVLANGSTTATLFKKYFKEWLSSGIFQAGMDEFSQKTFGKVVHCEPHLRKTEPSITIISAISVSPAAAKYTYEQKREFWETHVYRPGFKDLA